MTSHFLTLRNNYDLLTKMKFHCGFHTAVCDWRRLTHTPIMLSVLQSKKRNCCFTRTCVLWYTPQSVAVEEEKQGRSREEAWEEHGESEIWSHDQSWIQCWVVLIKNHISVSITEVRRTRKSGGDSPATELGRGMRYRGMEWAEWEDMLSRLRSGILLRL